MILISFPVELYLRQTILPSTILVGSVAGLMQRFKACYGVHVKAAAWLVMISTAW